jgi:hypothetical protein
MKFQKHKSQINIEAPTNSDHKINNIKNLHLSKTEVERSSGIGSLNSKGKTPTSSSQSKSTLDIIQSAHLQTD